MNFTSPGGVLRVVVTTVAFEMGVDCHDIRRIIMLNTVHIAIYVNNAVHV